MIDTFQAIALALIQGLTEFLPISSSAHLVIPSLVLGWPDQGLAFDVAVHVGTLAAVMLYYRQDLFSMAQAWLSSLVGGGVSAESRLVWYLLLATVPAGLVGLLGGEFIEANLRTLPVLATTTLVFGVLLGVADRRSSEHARSDQLSLPIVIVIGLAQALAPIPGVSRSGVTITAALFLGLSRQMAARFSFLMSIPIIGSAGLLKGLDLAAVVEPVNWAQLVLGMGVSGVTAYLCIATFIRLLDRVGMQPFVYYRVVLAAVLYALWLW